jgi:hypothetical protein
MRQVGRLGGKRRLRRRRIDGRIAHLRDMGCVTRSLAGGWTGARRALRRAGGRVTGRRRRGRSPSGRRRRCIGGPARRRPGRCDRGLSARRNVSWWGWPGSVLGRRAGRIMRRARHRGRGRRLCGCTVGGTARDRLWGGRLHRSVGLRGTGRSRCACWVRAWVLIRTQRRRRVASGRRRGSARRPVVLGRTCRAAGSATSTGRGCRGRRHREHHARHRDSEDAEPGNDPAGVAGRDTCAGPALKGTSREHDASIFP